MSRTDPPDDPRYAPIADSRQIRALRSTVRQELVDTLQALGSASVAELAAHLDRAADTLYYHVRALLKAGLLVQLPEPRQRGRHREVVYALPEPDKALKLVYRQDDSAHHESLSELVGAMLRSSQREFDAAIGDPDCVVDGPGRELWAGRIKGWLSPEELIRCNALIAELGALLSSLKTPERDRLYSLQFLLAPARRVGAPETWPYPLTGDPETDSPEPTPADRSPPP
jgi:DNA-binding transcriptional ArsR family regulator